MVLDVIKELNVWFIWNHVYIYIVYTYRQLIIQWIIVICIYIYIIYNHIYDYINTIIYIYLRSALSKYWGQFNVVTFCGSWISRLLRCWICHRRSTRVEGQEGWHAGPKGAFTVALLRKVFPSDSGSGWLLFHNCLQSAWSNEQWDDPDFILGDYQL